MDMQVGGVEQRQSPLQSVVDADAERQEARRAQRLANLRPIPKGTSLNPSGRPKKDKDLAAMAQAHAELAVKTLAQCLTDAESSWPAKVSAASELLDRGFGKAPQSLDVEHKVTLSDEFENFIRRLNGQHEAPMIEATVVEAAE